jgi:hypothetical protein
VVSRHHVFWGDGSRPVLRLRGPLHENDEPQVWIVGFDGPFDARHFRLAY